MSAIPERYRRVIRESLGVDDDRITPDARFTQELAADSLDVIEIQWALESEFGISISDDEAEACDTVAQGLALVERKLAA